MLKTTAAKIVCAALLLSAGAARATELSAYAGQSIALKDVRGTIYFVPKDDAFEVVTTLDSDGHPFRVVTSLKDGQSTTFSTPGAIGEKSTEVLVTRDGARLLINDGARDRRAELVGRIAD
jgi:hypothetical protein